MRGENIMPFYNGTYNKNYEDFKSKNIKIADNLYYDEKNKMLSFVNDIDEDSSLYSFTDPKVEEKDYTSVFYHFIFGSDINKAKEFIIDFDKIKIEEGNPHIDLYKKEKDDFYWYGNGRIVSHLLNNQDKLTSMLPNNIEKDNVYIIPLNMYYFICPICYHRTQQNINFYGICNECGLDSGGLLFGIEDFITPSKELFQKFPELYDEYIKEYKYKYHYKIASFDDEIEIDLDNLDKEIILDMTDEVYRYLYLKEKEKDPNYSWIKNILYMTMIINRSFNKLSTNIINC